MTGGVPLILTAYFSILARLICSQKLVGSKLVADIG
jgi:hypothetical protein